MIEPSDLFRVLWFLERRFSFVISTLQKLSQVFRYKIVIFHDFFQNAHIMSKNTNPTHMNAEPDKSDDLHKVCHYENSKVHTEGKNQDEQTRDQVYESMNLEPIQVYEHIHQHHQDEHPYADLSAL